LYRSTKVGHEIRLRTLVEFVIGQNIAVAGGGYDGNGVIDAGNVRYQT